jgi:hypothetical protein
VSTQHGVGFDPITRHYYAWRLVPGLSEPILKKRLPRTNTKSAARALLYRWLKEGEHLQ